MWKIIKKFILPGIILIAVGIFLFVKFYIFKKADVSVASKKPDIEIVAGDLVKGFETDEKAANIKYLNKIVEVKGVVDNVTETKADFTVYLKEKGSTSDVRCSFNKMEFQKNPVKSGDQVKIKGICSGYLGDKDLNLEEVSLDKCAVEK